MRKSKAWPQVRSYTSRVTCAEALARSPHWLFETFLAEAPALAATVAAAAAAAPVPVPRAGGGALPAPAPPWHLPAACLLVRGWHSSADKSEAWFGKSLLVP